MNQSVKHAKRRLERHQADTVFSFTTRESLNFKLAIRAGVVRVK